MSRNENARRLPALRLIRMYIYPDSSSSSFRLKVIGSDRLFLVDAGGGVPSDLTIDYLLGRKQVESLPLQGWVGEMDARLDG